MRWIFSEQAVRIHSARAPNRKASIRSNMDWANRTQMYFCFKMHPFYRRHTGLVHLAVKSRNPGCLFHYLYYHDIETMSIQYRIC
jgi:hypothetical protein